MFAAFTVAAIVVAAPGDPPVKEISLMKQAAALAAEGRFPEAIAAARKNVEETLRASGPDDAATGKAYEQLGVYLKQTGELDEAIALFEKALEIDRLVTGEHSSDVGIALANLAHTYQLTGDLEQTGHLLEESLQIYRDIEEPNARAYGYALVMLGLLRTEQWRYPEAREAFELVISLWRENYGPDSIHLAAVLHNLALVHKRTGDFAKAIGLYDESLRLSTVNQGPTHLDVAATLSARAVLTSEIGDDAGSVEDHERALAINQKLLPPSHPSVGESMFNLGMALARLGQHAHAESLLVDAVALVRQSNPDHYDIGVMLRGLATIHRLAGDLNAAEDFALQAMAFQTRTIGPGAPQIGQSHHILAGIYLAKRQYKQTIEHESLALESWGDSLGPDYAGVSGALQERARARLALADVSGAQADLDLALQLLENRMDTIDGLNEREALSYIQSGRTVLDRWLAMPDLEPEAAWQHVLRWKGVVSGRLRSVAAAAAVDRETAQVAAELRAVHIKLSEHILSGEPKEDLVTRASVLERDLMSRSAQYRAVLAAREASPRDLCEALEGDTALVEFTRLGNRDRPQYLAFVATPDCTIRLVDLGSAGPIDEAIEGWRGLLADPNAPVKRVDDRGRRLYEVLWEPINAVTDAGKIIVVPDGPVAAVPLGALPSADGYLVERHAFTWLDRATDLLEPPRDHDGGGALVIGGVDYGALRSSDARPACTRQDYGPLPGAEMEVEALAHRWKKSRRNGSVQTLRGGDATEEAVTDALGGRAIAHIATHGFFATGLCKSALEDGKGYSPMQLSGLVLADANTDKGLLERDGILTAQEVASLDLRDTGLVVLSACETGLGEIRSGEGVMGLRRAFAIAGASSLIMSLWSVSDKGTAVLMDDLYRYHLHRRRPLSAPDALRAAQLDRIAAGATPQDWAAFIATGR